MSNSYADRVDVVVAEVFGLMFDLGDIFTGIGTLHYEFFLIIFFNVFTAFGKAHYDIFTGIAY